MKNPINKIENLPLKIFAWIIIILSLLFIVALVVGFGSMFISIVFEGSKNGIFNDIYLNTCTFGTCFLFIYLPNVAGLIILLAIERKIRKKRFEAKIRRENERIKRKDFEFHREMEMKKRELEIQEKELKQREIWKKEKLKLAQRYERAERAEEAAKIYDELGLYDKANGIRKKYQLFEAQKFERAERFEEAAKIYEKLNMWDDAGRVRKKARGQYTKHIHVDVNELLSQIKRDGLAIPYKCPNCKASIDFDGSKTHLKQCPYCGTSIDFDTLSNSLNSILGDL